MAFQEALKGMQLAERWKATVNGIFDLWLHGVKNPALERFVRSEMGQYGFAMWSRAAREIQAYYAKNGSPLRDETADPDPAFVRAAARPAGTSPRRSPSGRSTPGFSSRFLPFGVISQCLKWRMIWPRRSRLFSVEFEASMGIRATPLLAG